MLGAQEKRPTSSRPFRMSSWIKRLLRGLDCFDRRKRTPLEVFIVAGVCVLHAIEPGCDFSTRIGCWPDRLSPGLNVIAPPYLSTFVVILHHSKLTATTCSRRFDADPSSADHPNSLTERSVSKERAPKRGGLAVPVPRSPKCMRSKTNTLSIAFRSFRTFTCCSGSIRRIGIGPQPPPGP
jgi:hypothetical protein